MLNENSHKCSICLSPYKKPIVLPCGHIFCELCIRGALKVKNNLIYSRR